VDRQILGIGNALTDMLCVLDSDALIEKFGLPKGSMQVVDKELQNELLSELSRYEVKKVRGGSVPNTLVGIEHLGMQVGFIGKLGCDEVARFFTSDLQRRNVTIHAIYSQTLPSGTCVSLISPDGERTLVTCLGAASQLQAPELIPGMFAGYALCHIDGYLLQNHELIERAMVMAKQAGAYVSLDMGSYNVVEQNLEFLKRIVPQYVDVVFANEMEAKTYTGNSDPEVSLDILSREAAFAVVKVGGKGSYVKHKNEKSFVPPLSGAKCVDTTGAGDLYASGFLYGLAMGCDITGSGRIGALVSGNVVEVVGTHMDDGKWQQIRSGCQQIISTSKKGLYGD